MLRPKLINYATAMMTEINPAINYGRSTFGMICRLSKFHKNKPFRDMTREDAIAFLDSLRKTEIEEDPLHQWIETYSPYRIRLLRFFRWLCSPNAEQSLDPKAPSTLKKEFLTNLTFLNLVFADVFAGPPFGRSKYP